jgi:hypothetical protein
LYNNAAVFGFIFCPPHSPRNEEFT